MLASVGWPRSGAAVKVVDAEGKSVPTCEIGEVIVRTGALMQGYWKNESATADTLRVGWLWNGNMSSFDTSGMLTLRDRCHCTLINQILRFQGILEHFCTLNYNISTGCSLQDLTPFERFQIASARIRSA